MSWLGLLLACVKPAPVPEPPPPSEPAAVQGRLDGWSIVRADHHDFVWTELWDDRAAVIAQEAIDRGTEAQNGPNGMPEDFDPETARRFFAAYEVAPRPAAWSWPDTRKDDEVLQAYHPVSGPMARHALEVVGVGPAVERGETLGLRVWFRALEGKPPSIAVTDWTADSSPLEGATMRSLRAMPITCSDLGIDPVPWADPHRTPCENCSTACSELPIGEDRLVSTEYVWQDELGRPSGSCAVAALKRTEGGTAYFRPTCLDVDPEACPHCMEHLVEGMYSGSTGPDLPAAVFGRGEQRWLVVNRSPLPTVRTCLARIPEPDEPIEPTACVWYRTDLGGF